MQPVLAVSACGKPIFFASDHDSVYVPTCRAISMDIQLATIYRQLCVLCESNEECGYSHATDLLFELHAEMHQSWFAWQQGSAVALHQ